MAHVSLSLIVFFASTALIALFLFASAVQSRAMVAAAAVWMLLQSAIALSGFYTVTTGLPPRFLLALGPSAILALTALLPVSRRVIAAMDLRWMILFHTIRILVELSLYCLFRAGQVPRLLTFEGGNLDILVGLSAPLAWWAYEKGVIARRGLLLWNVLGLLGLLNAVGRAVFSGPFRFERFGFEQPTVAILYFPFVLLPAFIVPAALFCHLASFRKLAAPAA